MSRRSHRSLRLGALALVAAMAIWPRARGQAGMAATDLGGRNGTTHSVAATAETTAAKLVSPPRTVKLAVAQTSEPSETDESQVSN